MHKPLLIPFALFAILLACQPQGSRGDDVVALSESLLAAYPMLTGSGRLDKSAQIRLVLVRQKAFAQKRIMDIGIAVGVSISSLDFGDGRLAVHGELPAAHTGGGLHGRPEEIVDLPARCGPHLQGCRHDTRGSRRRGIDRGDEVAPQDIRMDINGYYPCSWRPYYT